MFSITLVGNQNQELYSLIVSINMFTNLDDADSVV